MSRLVLFSLFFVGCARAAAPSPTVDTTTLPAVSTDPAAPLPLDPGVRIGTLPNGLTYYIERNSRPANRAELRLAVKAGSIVEEEDQRGLAHFLEHMAFNGTEHFPGQQLVGWLESTGMRFGADLNAYTSFDETVYQLQLPTDDPEMLATGVLVMRDWAGGLSFDDIECEKERGVVLEEWRLGQGIRERVQAIITPQVFYGSRYAERMPIGSDTTIKGFTCDAAKKFYQTWYRPDLMAVVVDGDIDPDQVEAWIRKAFTPLKNPENAVPRVWDRIPDHDETLVARIVDPELTQSGLAILHKVDDVEGQDHESYRKFLRDQMIFLMINERLAVAAQDPNAPYLGAGVSISPVGHQRSTQDLQVAPKQGREIEALEVAYLQVERARRFGFTQAELQRATDEMKRNMLAYYVERNKTDSSDGVDEILRVYLTNEPMPGTAYEYALSQVMLPSFTLTEMSDTVRTFFAPRSRVIEALFPQKAGVTPPSEADLKAILDRVAAAQLTPPDAEGLVAPLMSTLPAPGKATRIATDKALGTSTWRLSNGVTVVLKPTDFKADEIQFDAFSPGGTSLVPREDYIPAITATSLMLRSGVGDADAVALSKILAGRDAAVVPTLGRFDEGFYGGAKRADLETLFQLLYLAVTAPRFDEKAFELEKIARTEALRNRTANPDSVFEDAWAKLEWNDDPRQTNWTLGDLDAMNLQRSAQIYKDRFGDVGDFTFVFGGSFTEAEIVPLLERYLASLPTSGRQEMWQDDGIRRADGVHTVEMPRGLTPRGLVRLEFHGPFTPTWATRNELDAMASILETRLHEELREERGGTYGVGVDHSVEEIPTGEYTVTIEFECDPGRTDELLQATWTVIDEVRGRVYPQFAIDTIREKNLRSRETDSRTNGFWVGAIATALQRHEDPHDILLYDKRNRTLTPAQAAEMAKVVLNKQVYIQGILRPDAPTP